MALNKRRFVVLWHRWCWHRWRKYVLVLVLFAVYFVAGSEYSLLSRIESGLRLRGFELERDSLQANIAESIRLKRELELDNASLEKFAREQYFMKRANEDVYVFK